MRTSDHLQVVDVVETFSDVLAESVTSTSGIHAPSWSVIGVWPQEVTHWSFVGDFLNSFQRADVIEGFDWWRKTSVQTEELILNNSCQWQVIEEFSQCFPDVAVSVLSAALIIEAVHLGNLSWLVVTSQDDDSIFKSDFQGNEKGYGFNAVVT